MKKTLTISLVVGLIIAMLALFGSCFPATSTSTTDGGSSTTSTLYLIGFLVIIFALFYFVMIRPQRKKQRDQQNMIASIQKGDRVITAGGIYGVVDSVREDSLIIKVESGATLRVAKGSVMLMKDQQQQRR